MKKSSKQMTQRLEPKQEGERVFARSLLQRWKVKQNKMNLTLSSVLESDTTPSNIKGVWHNQSPDIWGIKAKGGDAKNDEVFRELDQCLRDSMRNYAEKGIDPEFVGIFFKVRKTVFIYATIDFPRRRILAPGEDEEGLIEGGVTCFSAGKSARLRVIFPEGMADYGRVPESKKLI